ncbi:MAG: hypothetical protein F6J87_30745 [Spirulina sp. SIO3F2]|nr:hypothetical protein [Spirulina sp. SIO3F2]
MSIMSFFADEIKSFSNSFAFLASIIFFGVWFGWDYYRNYIFFNNLARGQAPQSFLDFPDFETSMTIYSEAEDKIKGFVKDVLSSTKVEVSLKISGVELNNLCSQGKSSSKFEGGKHVFYYINEGYVYEKLMNFPSPMQYGGYSFQERRIEFTRKNSDWQEESIYISGRDYDREPVHIFFSSLLRFIFGIGERPYAYSIKDKKEESNEYKKYLSLIKAINEVKVEDGLLYFLKK